MTMSDGAKKREFEDLWRTCSHVVRWKAWEILENEAMAWDVMQESFLRLWRRWEAGETIRHPRAWLRRVSANLAKDNLRSAAHRRTRTLIPEAMDEADLHWRGLKQEEEPWHREMAGTVWAEVAKLGLDAHLVEIHYRWGMSVAEISDELTGVPRPTIYRRLETLLGQLREREDLLDLYLSK